MRRWLRWVVTVLAATVVLLLVAGYGFLSGWHVKRLAPSELSELLRPHDVLLRPEGEGPFPLVVLLHGCNGIRENNLTWAKLFVDQGYAALLVDSLRPRGLRIGEVNNGVCEGHLLWGRERAGDLLVTLADLRKWPFVDPSRIVLAGWSHGAWTIMDALALEKTSDLPSNLLADPGGLAGVAAAVLMYPYCGFASLSREGWARSVPSLMLLAERDHIVSAEACLEVAASLEGSGRPVSVHVVPGVDHAFDYTDLAADSTVFHDPRATVDAQGRVLRFLQSALARDEGHSNPARPAR